MSEDRATLKPCPFCGSGAHFVECKDEDSDYFGGTAIECRVCQSSSAMQFSLMEDARPLLAEKWNRRVA